MNADRATERRSCQEPGSAPTYPPGVSAAGQGCRTTKKRGKLSFPLEAAQGQTGLRSLYTLPQGPGVCGPGAQ